MTINDEKEKKPATIAVEQFSERIFPLGEITHKKMFGGYGVFEGGAMFALVTSDGGVYLKVDDTNRRRFDHAGTNKHRRMPYYQIPEQVLEDDSQLLEWTQEAIVVSKNAKK